MNSEEWCREKVSKLSNEDDRMLVLQEMKDFFTSIPKIEMARTANTIQLPLVFDCLNNSSEEQVDLACDILSLCMANLNLGESTNKYGIFIERALNHPYPSVKLMALNEIERNTYQETFASDLNKKESLLAAIVKCVADPDLGVSKKACEILTVFGQSEFGIQQLISDNILPLLRETMAVSEIVRLRIYEIVVNVAKKSDQGFQTFNSLGFLQEILTELDNHDVLLRLNIIELLMHLGECKLGFDYLESNNVLNKLSKSCEDGDSLTARLCEPGILKFFGHMAHSKPIEILSKYQNLIMRLFKNLDSLDFTIVSVSLDTLGHIGSTNEGKIALNSTDLMDSIIKTIATSTSFPTEVRVRALNCLENLLRVDDNDEKITAITLKWYNCMDENPMDIVWKYAKNPFSEFRLAGFGILNAMARQYWGQEKIRDTPGLLEFLLDRNVEIIKDCKEAKFQIVQILASSSVFDHLTLKELQRFVKNGPFYVEAVTEVAIEGNE